MSIKYMYFLIYLVKKVDILNTNEIKKILIVRLSALGDTIHTLPLLAALREKFPDAQTDWIVEDKAEKFVTGNPLLDNVYVLRKKNSTPLEFFKEFVLIIKKIRKEKYDIVMDTQQLFKSAVIMGLSSGKRKIALDGGREFSYLFANEIIKTNRKPFDINYHVVRRNLEIASYLGAETAEIKFIIPDLSNEVSPETKNVINNLDKNKKTIVIAPATTWENKHWNIQGWIDVINEFKDDCNIIITASEKERELTQKIVSCCPCVTDLTGKTTLADLVYIYSNVNLVVSPDSGSAHIAWAVSKPAVVTLFFATSSGRTAPFGNKYISISADCPCSPCMKKHCKLKTRKNRCIETIKFEYVVNIMKKVL